MFGKREIKESPNMAKNGWKINMFQMYLRMLG